MTPRGRQLLQVVALGRVSVSWSQGGSPGIGQSETSLRAAAEPEAGQAWRGVQKFGALAIPWSTIHAPLGPRDGKAARQRGAGRGEGTRMKNVYYFWRVARSSSHLFMGGFPKDQGKSQNGLTSDPQLCGLPAILWIGHGRPTGEGLEATSSGIPGALAGGPRSMEHTHEDVRHIYPPNLESEGLTSEKLILCVSQESGAGLNSGTCGILHYGDGA